MLRASQSPQPAIFSPSAPTAGGGFLYLGCAAVPLFFPTVIASCYQILRAWGLVYFLTQKGKNHECCSPCRHTLGGCAGQRPCCFAHQAHWEEQSWAWRWRRSPVAFFAAGHI